MSDKKCSDVQKGQSGVTLNKYIAQSGICSRRNAVELIKQGRVKVQGNVVTNPAFRVSGDMTVKINNKLIAKPEPYVYILLNKPRGFVTTLDDERGRKTVMELVSLPKKIRVYPVGRLDINTTGLLLLTNDGLLAQQLSHPRHKVPKIYEVKVHRSLEQQDLDRMVQGVRLVDGMAKIDSYQMVQDSSKQRVYVTLHGGKNRVVRRLFERMNYFVEKLDRVAYAGIKIKGLARGQWRTLTPKEVQRLKEQRA